MLATDGRTIDPGAKSPAGAGVAGLCAHRASAFRRMRLSDLALAIRWIRSDPPCYSAQIAEGLSC
jgi:hypothetical protein